MISNLKDMNLEESGQNVVQTVCQKIFPLREAALASLTMKDTWPMTQEKEN
jgi:hypothetical protein